MPARLEDGGDLRAATDVDGNGDQRNATDVVGNGNGDRSAATDADGNGDRRAADGNGDHRTATDADICDLGCEHQDHTGRSPSAGPAARKPGSANAVLVVLHQAHSTPGRVGQLLLQRGYKLDIRRPSQGDGLPSTTRDHAAVVIFGGPMSANDPDAFIRREIDFIGTTLRDETPYLGICLGAQMLARAIGGAVAPHPEGQVEIGYYDIEPTGAGCALMEWPRKVYQWHREGFATPRGTELLATGTHYEEQAFRVGTNAFGLQFHPEITLHMLYRWTTRASERMTLPGARCRRDHFAGRAVYDGAVKAWLDAFLDRWLAGQFPAAGPASVRGTERAVSPELAVRLTG